MQLSNLCNGSAAKAFFGSGITLQSSRPAYGGRLTFGVKRVHMASRIVPALSRSELASRLDAVFNPREGQFIEGQIDTMLLEFCLNCPDPPAAMDAVIEAPEGVGCEEILDQVLSMPARSPGSYSEEELSADHPLRTWRVQLRVV